MARVYLPADARCRQLERLVRRNPGITLELLGSVANLSYRATAAYVARLQREARLVVRFEEPVTPRGSTKSLFPAVDDSCSPPASKKAA